MAIPPDLQSQHLAVQVPGDHVRRPGHILPAQRVRGSGRVSGSGDFRRFGVLQIAAEGRTFHSYRCSGSEFGAEVASIRCLFYCSLDVDSEGSVRTVRVGQETESVVS